MTKDVCFYCIKPIMAGMFCGELCKKKYKELNKEVLKQ